MHYYKLLKLMLHKRYMLYLINKIHYYMKLELMIHYKYFIQEDMMYKLLQLLNNNLSYKQYLKLLMNKGMILLYKLNMLNQLSRILKLDILMRKQQKN
jgi:hypothetical protein